MKVDKNQIEDTNRSYLDHHKNQFDFLSETLQTNGIEVDAVLEKLAKFQVAIPSWALGAGGTRFGRFSFQGEPSNLEQKIHDVGVLHILTQTAGAISLHIPWDVPED